MTNEDLIIIPIIYGIVMLIIFYITEYIIISKGHKNRKTYKFRTGVPASENREWGYTRSKPLYL
jgi:hypothetical protein